MLPAKNVNAMTTDENMGITPMLSEEPLRWIPKNIVYLIFAEK